MKRQPDEPWVPLPFSLQVYILALATLTLACGIAEFIAAHKLLLHGRYIYPLLQEYYPDVEYFAIKFGHIHHLSFFTTDSAHPFMYPAPVVLPYMFVYGIGRAYFLSFFLGVMLFCFAVAGVLLFRALQSRGLPSRSAAVFVGANLLLAYPLWFVVHQANMEFVVWVLLSSGLLAFFNRRPYLAGICFGIAGSMKLFPFVYLGLLLARREYRAIAVSLASAAAITLGSLWIVYPNVSVGWRLIQGGISTFREMYVLHLRQEKGFDHSLFGLFKQLMPQLPPPSELSAILSAYLFVAASLGIVLYFVRVRKLPVINQLLSLCIASILLPPTSFDYTLMHLYAPWVLLVFYAVHAWRNERQRSVSPALLPALLCFAVLFAPLTEFIANGETFGGPIRALVLVLLLVLALTCPFHFDALEAAYGCEPWGRFRRRTPYRGPL